MEIPDPALVVLVGPSGAGKSHWAAARFRPEEIVSSDRLRAIVGSGEHDLDASGVAFDLLDQIVAARIGRRLSTVVDTLGLDDDRRRLQLQAAREAGIPAVLVVFSTREEVCRARNRARSRPVPASVLTGQLRRLRQIGPRLQGEGWDLILEVSEEGPVSRQSAPGPEAKAASRGPGLALYLQISRFPRAAPLGPWLTAMAAAAESTGFHGLAVMDHLVQIPQVGREWDNLLEAYTALAYVAATTSDLQVGTLATNATLRNPALLAKMVATLDVLSGGRAFCGLGAGWFVAEEAAYGYEPRSRSQRLDILEDTIQILRSMWEPGKATYVGKVHSVNEAVSYPRPLHSVPIYVGGRKPRTVALAVRLADGLNVAGWASIDEVLPAIKGRLDDSTTFQFSILDTPLLGSDRGTVAASIERWRGRLRAEVFAERHHAGVADRHISRYRAIVEKGVNAIFVSPVGLAEPAEVHGWAPVIEALSDA